MSTNKPSKQKYLEQHTLLNRRYEAIKQQGFSDKSICQTIGISYASLLRWKARKGFLKRRPRKVTNFTRNEYDHLKQQGFSDTDICKVLDCNAKTLFNWKKRHQIESCYKKYPKTPKELPNDCRQYIDNLYPLIEKIKVSDVKSLATERLLRSAYIFHCKANEGRPLSLEMQRRYFSRVIGFCFVEYQIQKSSVLESFSSR